MYLEGKIRKDGKFWLVEVQSLDVMTQGKSKKDALKMLKDALKFLVNQKGFKLIAHNFSDDRFLIETNNETALMALMLKRQRVKHNLSLSQMAERLNVRSRNTYAQYEQGRNQPSLSKMQEFFSAMNAHLKLSLHVTG